LAASISPFRVATSLRLGDRVLTRCDDGVLLAEYALFDVSDIVLRATDPVTVREVGYMTTATEALGRLERAGVTLDLALEAAQALSPEVAATYARGATARSLVARLGAHELFDGAIFSASAQRYEGAWLDLRTLAGALTAPAASSSLQALHLCAALSEVAEATTLHLATAAATRSRRPGERTHQRVVFEFVDHLPRALRSLQPLAHPPEVEPARDRLLRRALLARVRERSSADTNPQPRAHLANLEGALTLETMANGPLTDPHLRALERRLAGGETEGVAEELDRLERTQGAQAPGVRYLRARAALLRGDEPPRSVAQALSELVEGNQGFHEAALVAARTWLAVGEDAHARYFARRLFDDPSAGDSERLVALEILEATTSTELSNVPPAASYSQVPPMAAPRVPTFQPFAHLPPPRAFPPDAGSLRPGQFPAAPRRTIPPDIPAPETQRSPPPPLPSAPRRTRPPGPSSSRPPPARTVELEAVVTQSTPAAATPSTPAVEPGKSRPPRPTPTVKISSSRPPRASSSRPPPPTTPSPPEQVLTATVVMSPEALAQAQAQSQAQPRGRGPGEHYEAELVETLALPPGATESALGLNDLPRTPLQARIALTRLSRDLARDYRLAYGKTLRCNALAVDAMQQHLTHRFAGATLSDHGVTWELRRHGALVSEILARALGGVWVDIGPSEPGYWSMSILPGLVTYPIGRVYRFVALGNRERDLVDYFLELEGRVRRAGVA
jgi:hypothetical protein